MQRYSRLAAAAMLAVLLTAVGCSPTNSKTTYATVTIGSLTYRVELAQTATQQREGLGNRHTLPDGTGMLFQFAGRSQQQVWMAGMRMPIDIAWIVDNKVLTTDSLPVCNLSDPTQCPRWTSPGVVDALLEVSAGSLDSVDPGMNFNAKV